MADSDNHDRQPPVDPRIHDAAREGCPDARLRLSRRFTLGLGASLFSSAFLPNAASAATDPEARLLVVLLRGGLDGLNTLVPKLDPLYQSLRGDVAVPFASTLSLGADFGLNPALTRVHEMFNAGDAAFVPSAGIPVRNRSHFECQDNLENGLPANSPQATGWLNRLLGALPAGDPIRIKRGIEIGGAPLILRGPEPVLGWSPTWFDKVTPENIVRLQSVYRLVDNSLWQSIWRGIAADRMALAAGAGGGGDISPLRKSFIGAARLMRTAGGPRIAVLSIDAWDTHADEGAVTGYFRDTLAELDQALGDFKREIGTLWPKTVAICATEFGRTVLANGDKGSDHGIGGASIIVGGAVRKGFVGDWPGLAPNKLEDGDLRPTVDLRGVFKGLLRDHLGVPASVLETTVFPGSAIAPPIANLVKTPSATSALSYAAAQPKAKEDILRYREQYGVN